MPTRTSRHLGACCRSNPHGDPGTNGSRQGHAHRCATAELSDRFGGLTAHVRAPAAGLWEAHPGHTERDDIVIYEVMVDLLDPEWWWAYRRELEGRFGQEELVIRAMEIRRL